MDLFHSTLATFSTPSGRRAVARWATVHPELDALLTAPTVAAFEEIADHTAGATRTLVTAFQADDHEAALALLLAKRKWILRIARHAAGSDHDERLAGVVAHFLCALREVPADHANLEGQLFWRSLRAVHSERNRAQVATFSDDNLDPAGDDVVADVEAWMSVAGVLAWASDRGHLSDRDVAALSGMHDRDNVVSVRTLAREWGEPEDRLESALRRAVRRLRGKVLAHRDDLDLFLMTTVLATPDSAPRELAAA